jgi:hypothetical protein
MHRNPYALWLGLGLLFALSGVGFDSPDEHFPTLEAAGRILFGYSQTTWEWQGGLRSWLQPGILAAALKPWVALGVENRLWLDSIARVFNVFWMLPAIWAIGRLSSRESQLWAAAAWPFLAWATRHGSDTFGIPPLLVGFALFVVASRPLLAGLFLGLAFELRFTTGVFSVIGVACAAFVTRQRRFSDATLAGFGFILSAVLLSCLDGWIYHRVLGSWRIPAWEFFRFNILEGSGQFHASPWYELLLDQLLLWIPPLGWIALARGWRRVDPWALGTWAASLAVLCVIRHKELRFIFPLLPLALIATAPHVKGAWRSGALALNAVFVLVVFVFYRDPHGALVRALDAASSRTGSEVRVAGVTADVPQFYLRHPMTVALITDDDARRACREKTPGLFVTRENCPSCELVSEVALGPGLGLRQRISPLPAPARFVLNCPGARI